MSNEGQSVITPHVRPGCYAKAMTSDEWTAIIAAQSFHCYYCCGIVGLAPLNRSYRDEDMIAQPDHLVPVSRNGCSCSGNVVAACPSCNRMKTGRTIEEFLADRPQFLKIAGNFSTRVALLTRTPALFWNLLPVEVAENLASLSGRKDMNRALGLKPHKRRQA